MTDHDELRRLAEAATPGPWRVSDFGEGVTTELHIDIADVIQGKHDAAYIAAADPQTILGLLDLVEGHEATADIDRLALDELAGLLREAAEMLACFRDGDYPPGSEVDMLVRSCREAAGED